MAKRKQPTRAESTPDAVATKRGRKQSYRSEFTTQAEKLCALGATDEEISDFFGVSARTVYRWKIQHPEFCQALKAGKETADARVIRSLYNRAVGYSHDSEEIFCFRGDVTRAQTVKHYPPDITAAIFWLKNRQPELWRDRQEVTGADGAALLQPVINITIGDERKVYSGHNGAGESRPPSAPQAG